MRTLWFWGQKAWHVAALGVVALLLASPAAMDDERLDFAESATPGTLVICGGGDTPDDVLYRFVEVAGGRQARIVVVTTASETADTEEVETELEFWRDLELASLHVLHTRSRDMANDPDFTEPLAEATGIWFIGGKQSWLTDTYLGTTTEELWHDVLKRGGVIGGESAGAAVMSRVMIRSGDTEPEVGEGFGFLPGTVIDQHFLARNRQDRLLNVLATHPGLVGLGIDERTAVIIKGRRLQVLGDSQVVTYLSPTDDLPASVHHLDAGVHLDLGRLKKSATKRTHTRK